MFGVEILNSNGEVDRKKIKKIVFDNSNMLQRLNMAIHPIIINEIEREIEILLESQKIVFLDAPLLIEADMKKLCDTTIAVVSEDKEIQIQRIIERDKIDRKHAVARLGAQHPNEFYTENCEYTIVNNEKLEEQIKNVIEKIMLNF